MSDTVAAIRQRLSVLEPQSLAIRDTSAAHAGHAHRGSGGHFHVHIISARFIGHDLKSRHKLIYQALGDLFPQSIHALSIDAKTPD